MRKENLFAKALTFVMIACIPSFLASCHQKADDTGNHTAVTTKADSAEYFLLRPKLEKMYGYTQAVKVGNLVKVGGVISIDDEGKPLAAGDYAQQMKNCYANLEKVLKHYGLTFDDVILENIYTTSMEELQKNAAYRHEIYPNHFPTGSWIGIKELGMPGMMIEIELEALVPKK